MGTKMNEETYRKMIALDIEYLKQFPDTLERKHIIEIIKESVENYYKPSDGNQAKSKNANCAIFDVSKSVCPCTGNPLKHDWCVRCDLFNKCKLAVRQTDC